MEKEIVEGTIIRTASTKRSEKHIEVHEVFDTNIPSARARVADVTGRQFIVYDSYVKEILAVTEPMFIEQIIPPITIKWCTKMDMYS